jgi:hypothetical protein
MLLYSNHSFSGSKDQKSEKNSMEYSNQVEDKQLAHQMALAEHAIWGPASSLTRRLGYEVMGQYFTPEQQNEQRLMAAQASQEAEAAYEQDVSGNAREIYKWAVLARANGHNNLGVINGLEVAEEIFNQGFAEASREQAERGAVALAAVYVTEQWAFQSPVAVKEKREVLVGDSRTIENTGSPVLISVDHGVASANCQVMAVPRGDRADGWDFMRLREIESAGYYCSDNYELEMLLPGDDGMIHLGREDDPQEGIQAFGISGEAPTELIAGAVLRTSRRHASIVSNKEGGLTLIDHSKWGTSYSQVVVDRNPQAPTAPHMERQGFIER